MQIYALYLFFFTADTAIRITMDSLGVSSLRGQRRRKRVWYFHCCWSRLWCLSDCLSNLCFPHFLAISIFFLNCSITLRPIIISILNIILCIIAITTATNAIVHFNSFVIISLMVFLLLLSYFFFFCILFNFHLFFITAWLRGRLSLLHIHFLFLNLSSLLR